MIAGWLNLASVGREKTLVIAEIGVNHDGSPSRAMELVDHAHAAGADAVKLQIFSARALMHASGGFADYQRSRVEDADPAAMLGRYELPPAQIVRIVEAIRARGMLPIATPFSPSDVQTVAGLDLPVIKIASPDLVNLPLLERAAALRRPLLVSTGAATLDEVATSVQWLTDLHCRFALMHCVSSYPTPAGDAHLRWIGELASEFGVPVGFSDHTEDELSGALAVAAGASIIEKHLTYDRGAGGPDHAASADPAQFARYVRQIRRAEVMCGTGGKRVLRVEEDVRRASRQSLVLTRPVAADHPLTEADLTVQRPGTGIPASMFRQILGRRILRSLPAGTMLQWEMLLPLEQARQAV